MTETKSGGPRRPEKTTTLDCFMVLNDLQRPSTVRFPKVLPIDTLDGLERIEILTVIDRNRENPYRS